MAPTPNVTLSPNATIFTFPFVAEVCFKKSIILLDLCVLLLIVQYSLMEKNIVLLVGLFLKLQIY